MQKVLAHKWNCFKHSFKDIVANPWLGNMHPVLHSTFVEAVPVQVAETQLRLLTDNMRQAIGFTNTGRHYNGQLRSDLIGESWTSKTEEDLSRWSPTFRSTEPDLFSNGLPITELTML